MDNRVGGIIEVKVDGQLQSAKGEFSYNLGKPKREAVTGSDRMHGYKETPQVAFIEGAITDRKDLNLSKLVTLKDTTATLTLANGKIIILRDAYYAGDGTGSSDEGEIEFRMESPHEAEEVR